ncbi:tRNA (adenosine(37)-N6)-threonylcarbamoyltransferase complex dimerization subunit type 1 TsaB [Candidatus Neptunochlamydia vexilliferae]|nr:tRNA (adenosine(37)-N6)-threonylcarbamoyltransferase complex dimerization subunit type 1 TsaB [Candidatus Neptunochlamydia vexilliferae]
MKFLIIDTSGTKSFVALFADGKLNSYPLPERKQSQTLLPAVKKLLNNQEISFIALGTGPGSFTGTRIGVMTAKALSLSMDLPLVPFSSENPLDPEALQKVFLATGGVFHTKIQIKY